MHHLQLVEAQREVQDLGELLGQGLLPLQVLGGVVVGLAGQSAQEAAQRCFCEGGGEEEERRRVRRERGQEKAELRGRRFLRGGEGRKSNQCW